MRLSVLDSDELTPATPSVWRPGASIVQAGIVFVHGRHLGVVAPTDTVATWLTGRYGADAALVTELAGFVYHRKGWFADDLDPLTLRDRRPGQYELRVFTELDDGVVPLLALDLAPVRGAGTWRDLDQSAPNHAASIVEIGVVPGDQPVVQRGEVRPLDDVDCTTDVVWEASRLAALAELARTAARPSEAGVPAFVRIERAVASLGRLADHEASSVADAARGLFGVCLAWVMNRLPIELVVGLSQGNVVPAFTASMGADRAKVHRRLQVERWHADAEAFRYAPGYFATGQVRGYALDGTQLAAAAVGRALPRLARAAAGRPADVLAGLTRSA